MTGVVRILPVAGLPEVRDGDDLAALIAARSELRDGDVVVVASKVVSKAEGAVVRVPAGTDAAAARRDLARAEAVRVVADSERVLVVETRHGLVCANAGVDASNTAPGTLLRLPDDPDASARRLRDGLRQAAGVEVAVVVSDTFGRPWRRGQTDVAIGVAGLPPVRDERGGRDRHGRLLEVTEVAVADEVAAAADLVRRKADGVPVVVVRGLEWAPDAVAAATALVRPAAEDLFRRGRGGLAAALAAVAPPAPGRSAARADLDRVAAAARTVAGVTVDVEPARLLLRADPDAALHAGVAAGLAVAAGVDLGLAAAWRPAHAGEDAVAVVELAGPQPDDAR